MRASALALGLTLAALALSGCIADVQCGEAKPTNARADVLFLGQSDPETARALLEDAGWTVDTASGAYTSAGRALANGGSISVLVLPQDEGGTDGSTLLQYEMSDPQGGALLGVRSAEEARDALVPHIGPVNARFAQVLGEPLQTQYKGGSNDCSPGGLIG